MRFTFFKPLHGWRALVGEVAIIVIGVLIALAAEQAVQNWRWNQDAHAALEQLREESSSNFFYAAERVVAQPCLAAQLDRLEERVLNSGPILTPAPAIEAKIGAQAYRQPTARPWATDIYESIVADGVASHFRREARPTLSNFYAQIETLKALAKASDTATAQLTVMLSPIALDAGVRERIVMIIAEERARTGVIANDSVQNMASLTLLGQAPPTADIEKLLDGSGTIKYCRERSLPLADWRRSLAEQLTDGRQPQRLI